MGSTFGILLSLSLALGQVSSTPVGTDISYSNERGLGIPINLPPELQATIRELILYSSGDKGKTWQQYQVVTPDKRQFEFHAAADGEYWFQVGVVNKQGKQDPENPYSQAPSQKTVIDSLKPLVKVAPLERRGDEVTVRWEIQDEYPNWSTFKIEYQAHSSLAWTPVTAPPAINGQTTFRPNASGPLTVRVSIADLAKNLSSMTATDGQSQSNIQTTQFISNPPPGSGPIPAPNFPPVPENLGTSTAPPVMPPPVGLDTKAPIAASDTAPPPYVPPQPQYTPPQPTEKPTPTPPSPQWAPKAQTPIADSTSPPLPAYNPPPTVVHRPRPLPPLQFVNSPEVTLEYEISKVGPSGVASVLLYMSRNDGQTWEKYGYDDHDLKPGRHQRLAKLEGDGIYGFILVVKSRAGLGRREPVSGEIPDIRFEVDSLAPAAQLFRPEPDPQRPNTLILSWSARDNNLANNPITLEWSERRDGPWRPIAVSIPNSGRIPWQLPEGLPYQVFLRLKVRDQAGNEGVAVTPDPQIVDLSEPEGRVVGVAVPR